MEIPSRVDPLDIDKALNRRLVLTYSGNLPITEFSKSRAMTFQAGIMLGKETMEISCFIPDDLEQNREISIFLAQNKVKRHKKNYILNFSFNNPVVFKALHETVSTLKSPVVDDLTLSNGLYFLSMRFNECDMKAISNGIIHYSSKIDELGINYLGDSPGINSIAKEANSFIPLVEVEITFTPPESFIRKPVLKSLGDEWVAEARYMSSDQTFRQLVIPEDEIENPDRLGISVVDEQRSLYEMEIEIPLMGYYFQRSYDYRIIRMRRLLSFSHGKMTANFVVPELTSSDFLKVLSETSKKFPDWNLALNRFQAFRQ